MFSQVFGQQPFRMKRRGEITDGEIKLALEDFFERWLAFLAEVQPEQLTETVKLWYGKVSKEFILLTMDNHLSHHRGQVVVYLRLLGIQPPAYVGW